mmetsp:Transcript_69045/g.121899  ORF Transcript_69045/g.121899 Transcript_69045/m.121899 type:complete len:213 (-) Transcript_69045:1915-2553(-)
MVSVSCKVTLGVFVSSMSRLWDRRLVCEMVICSSRVGVYVRVEVRLGGLSEGVRVKSGEVERVVVSLSVGPGAVGVLVALNSGVSLQRVGVISWWEPLWVPVLLEVVVGFGVAVSVGRGVLVPQCVKDRDEADREREPGDNVAVLVGFTVGVGVRHKDCVGGGIADTVGIMVELKEENVGVGVRRLTEELKVRVGGVRLVVHERETERGVRV